MVNNNNKKIKIIIKCALLFLALFSLVALYKGCGSTPSTSDTATASVSALKRSNIITSDEAGGNYRIVSFLNDTKADVQQLFSTTLSASDFIQQSIKVAMPQGMSNGNIGYARLQSLDIGTYDQSYTSMESYPFLTGGLYTITTLQLAIGFYDTSPTPQWQVLTTNLNNASLMVNALTTYDLNILFIGKNSVSGSDMGLRYLYKTNNYNSGIAMTSGYIMISGYFNNLTSYEAGVENGILQGIQQVVENPNDNGLYNQQQYDDNYQEGYNDGSQSNINVSWIEGILNSATSVLNLEVLPGIKIIYLAGVFIVIKFVVFILGVIK